MAKEVEFLFKVGDKVRYSFNNGVFTVSKCFTAMNDDSVEAAFYTITNTVSEFELVEEAELKAVSY